MSETKPTCGSIGTPTVRSSIVTVSDLLASERWFDAAMQRLGYGRFQKLRIERGELCLTPPPAAQRDVKFGTAPPGSESSPSDFELKKEVREFFEFVRGMDKGEIDVLEIRGGLPNFMRVNCLPDSQGDH